MSRFRFPDGDSLLYRMQQKDGACVFVVVFIVESPYTRLNNAISLLVGVMWEIQK